MSTKFSTMRLTISMASNRFESKNVQMYSLLYSFEWNRCGFLSIDFKKLIRKEFARLRETRSALSKTEKVLSSIEQWFDRWTHYAQSVTLDDLLYVFVCECISGWDHASSCLFVSMYAFGITPFFQSIESVCVCVVWLQHDFNKCVATSGDSTTIFENTKQNYVTCWKFLSNIILNR